MNLKIQFDCANVDWEIVASTLKKVGMASYSPEIHQQAFANSRVVVFVFDGDRLVGFGRALADGVYQGAVYDVAILPEYQGQGIGRMIVERIKRSLPQCNLILYAAPGKENFYAKLGFKRMKTGMALFGQAAEMARKGFTD